MKSKREVNNSSNFDLFIDSCEVFEVISVKRRGTSSKTLVEVPSELLGSREW